MRYDRCGIPQWVGALPVTAVGIGLLCLLLAGCVTEPVGPGKSSHMENMKLYSDSEIHDFRPLLSRYNLDPPLSGDLAAGVEEDKPDLFQPFHKYSKMRYLGDDGSVTIHYYLETGKGEVIATLMVGHLDGLVRRPNGFAELAANEVTVFPSFIIDNRRTANVGVGKSGFYKYGVESRPACDLLVVRSSPEKLLLVEDFINRVLTEIPQIEVKVRVIEVNLRDRFEYGVDSLIYKNTSGQFFLNTEFLRDADGNLIKDPNSGLYEYESGGWTTKFNTESFLLGGADNFQGSIFHVGGVHDSYVLDAFIEVVQRTTDSQILTAPKITVLNGHKAVIETGQSIPVQEAKPQANTVSFNYKYEPTGVKLVILPTLLMDNTMQVEVNGEVTTLAGRETVDTTTSGQVEIPIFTKRNISTVVTVKDGEAFALGGLLATSEIQLVQKIPLLGDIPGLGHLFKSKSTETRKSHIIFFVEPRIVKPEEALYMPE